MRVWAAAGVGWGAQEEPRCEKQGAGLIHERRFVETHLSQDLLPTGGQSQQSSGGWTLALQFLASPEVLGSHAWKGSCGPSSLRAPCRGRQEGLCPA